MRFAVFTVGLPEFTPEEAVAELREIGYDGVEWRVTDQQPSADDQPGFWESLGYHNYGDPWKEQRYQGD